MDLDCTQRKLIDGWQRAFPLVPRPFAEIASDIGVNEGRVLAELRGMQASDVLSRIGATVRPNTVGASLLAAMRVAPDRLDEIADIVTKEPCVNHNYEREHEFNLWFVVAAPDKVCLDNVLTRLRAATGQDILELPLERAYYLDLGFSLDLSRGTAAGPSAAAIAVTGSVDSADRTVLAAIEDGLELQPRPYLALARRCGLGEDEVIARLDCLISGGIISRFGLIVRHRALGISANAMLVWDIGDEAVDAIGERFAGAPFVTLCYRRPRRMPDWPYNLFCMVHGRDRATVEAQAASLADLAGEEVRQRAALFSKRCFVQRGARFKAA